MKVTLEFAGKQGALPWKKLVLCQKVFPRTQIFLQPFRGFASTNRSLHAF